MRACICEYGTQIVYYYSIYLIIQLLNKYKTFEANFDI